MEARHCPKCGGAIIERGEFPEIAACLMCGWREYAGEGYIRDMLGARREAAYAKDKRRKHRIFADPLLTEWAEIFVRRAEEGSMISADAYERYAEWAEARGERPLAQSQFNLKLGAHFKTRPAYGMMDYRGERRYLAVWQGLELHEADTLARASA